MFEVIQTYSLGGEIVGLTQGLLAQVPVQVGPETPEQAALLFSGPRFFVALISGIALAFAFQFLLTNLSVAAGMSYLGHQDHSDSDASSGESASLGRTIKKVGFGLGLWTLVTVSIALFFACFLAVRLSLLFSPGLGAIVGLVIWAAYFSLLVWLSSSTMGSLLGSVVGTVTSGFQSMVNTVTAALGTRMASDRVVSTAGAAASAVRRELTGGIDTLQLRDTVEEYLENLRTPQMDVQRVRNEFEAMLRDPELKAIAADENLNRINRQTFVEMLNNRTDLSKRDVERLADQLDASWRKFVRENKGKGGDPVSQFQDYLASALPENLRSNDLQNRLDQLMAAINSQNQPAPLQGNDQSQQPGLVSQASNLAMSTIMGLVMGRQDLSDLDVEKILGQLRTAKNKVGEQAGKVMQSTGATSDSYSTIRADVENYLLNTYSWEMKPDRINRDFREVLFDPEASPAIVRQELDSLNRDYFHQVLVERGVFTLDEINRIVDQLDSIRLETLMQVRAAEVKEQISELHNYVKHRLRYAPKAELLTENLQYDFSRIVGDADADLAALQEYLNQLNADVFRQLLGQRTDDPMTPQDVEQVVSYLMAGRDRALEKVTERRTTDESQLKGIQSRIENYLRHTHREELNPEGIKHDLQLLRDDPQLGMAALRTRFSQFDRNTLVQLLTQRQDLTPDQVNQTLTSVESSWNSVIHAPQSVAGRVQEQTDQVTARLSDYLRRTQLDELSPEGIQRDLETLFNDPKAGLTAWQQRLSRMDRETLVKLLSQREGVSEEQVNRAIDQVQMGIRRVVRAPRRLASRTQERIFNFESSLEDYLRNTDKEELNPEGIKRDLQLLVRHPRAGLSNLGDRLSRVDRSTMVALLSQRQDMTPEEANRIVDQIESTRDQVLHQIRGVQYRVQSMLNSILDRIRDYLNSLERPELNYEGIRSDIRTLFSDPRAGFDALRDRLSHFNRDTLVAVLSSREDVSSEDVNHILDQVESARVSALQRAERLQLAAQQRVEDMKRQAKKQAEETRKAAETASWWLFGTALASAIFSAIGGAIAVTGLQ